jgi:hypothetical protein
MHAKTAFVALIAATLATAAYAQQPSSTFPQPLQAAPFGGYGHASTFAEGAQRGRADIIRAAGEYNYNTAAAWLIGEHAYSKRLENAVQRTQTFFEKRRIHDHYIAETKVMRPDYEQQKRLAQWAAPDRLAPGQLNRQLGSVAWPAVLEGPAFNLYRLQLEALFESRSAENSGLGSVNYSEVQKVAVQMRSALQSRLRQMDSTAYMQAKKFIESVAYEARFAIEPGEELAAK